MNSVAFNNFVDRTRFNNFEAADAYPLNRCKISLKNKDLWRKFNELDTEMIITKSGRRMFPSFHIQIADLDPNAYYCILLEMTPASHCRYKYSASGGWSPAGTEEAQSPHRIYLHPESPAKGDYWMSQPVSFGRVKLTNTPNAPSGQVVLSSMHKYQPRVIVVKSNDPRNLMWAPSTSVAFPETQFIAVTAYQNEKITQLKIDNNPFAKGFRANGQAKCKRKRVNLEDEVDSVGVKKQRTDSESNDDERISICSSPHVKTEVDSCTSTPSHLSHSPVARAWSSHGEHKNEVISGVLYSPTRQSVVSNDSFSPSCSSSNCSPVSSRIVDLRQELRSNEISSPISSISVRSPLPSPFFNAPLQQRNERMGYPLNNNYYPYSYGFNMGYFSPYPNMFGTAMPYFYNQYYNSPRMESAKDLSIYRDEKETKKFTDFSISTIMAK